MEDGLWGRMVDLGISPINLNENLQKLTASLGMARRAPEYSTPIHILLAI